LKTWFRLLPLIPPGNARRVLARMEQRAATLEQHPARERIVPELACFGLNTWRELIVKPYREIYRIEAGRGYVLTVVDGRRDLEDLLLKRLLKS